MYDAQAEFKLSVPVANGRTAGELEVFGLTIFLDSLLCIYRIQSCTSLRNNF